MNNKTLNIFAVALIAIGAFALGFQYIRYTVDEKSYNLGPLHATVEKKETIPLPPIVGGSAIVIGVIILLLNKRQ